MAVSEQALEHQRREEDAQRRMAETLRQVSGWFRLNAVQLSARSGIKRSTLQTKLDGKKMWAPEVELLADAFGVPVDVLYWPADRALAWLRTNRPNGREDLPDPLMGTLSKGALLSTAA